MLMPLSRELMVSRLCCNKCFFVILNIKQSRFTPIVLHEYVCEFPIYFQLACFHLVREGKLDYSDETTDTSDNTQTSHKNGPSQASDTNPGLPLLCSCGSDR